MASEPILARPPSTAYRIQKLIRRNKLAFAAAALVTLTVVLGVSGVILVQHRANQDYRQRLYVSGVNRAGLAWRAGQSAQMRALLDRCPADLRNWEWNFLHQQLDRWEPKVVLALTNLGSAVLSADGRLLALAAGEAIQIREFPGGQWRANIPFATASRSPFSVSPRSEFVATLAGETGAVTVWNIRTGNRVWESNHGGPAGALAWFNSEKILVTGGEDGIIRLWNTATAREERQFSATPGIIGLAVAPDDQSLAVGTSRTEIQLLDATIGAVKRTLRSQGPFNSGLKFSPDGRKLVVANDTAGGFQSDKRVWSLDDEGSLDLRSGSEGKSYSFSGDSRRLVVGDAAGMIQIWDLKRRVEVERFSAHVNWAGSVQLLPDDRILSAGPDGLLKLWQARRKSVVQLKGYPNSLRTLAFSPDSRWLASAGVGGEVFLWDARGGHLAGKYAGHLRNAHAVAFSRDGRLASAGGDQMVRMWDPVSLRTKWETSLAPAPLAYWMTFSPDGRRLYVPSMTDALTVLDAATGARLNSISGLENTLDGIAVSPDGKLIVLCQKTLLSVRGADDLRELWRVPALPDRCAAFSPDGKWIATGDTDGAVSLWEVASSGQVRHVLRGHAASVSGVSFHPDGSRLVSSAKEGIVKVWDWRNGVEVLTLPMPGGGLLWHAVFSPDGKTIAAAGGDGVVTLWKVEQASAPTQVAQRL